MNVPRLHGLVLAGGRSSRMQRDKAAHRIPRRRNAARRRDEAAGRPRGARLRLGARRISGTIPRARGTRTSSIAATSKAPSPASAPRSPATRTRPGWCSPATCRSSTRHTLDTLLLARDPNFDATAYRSSHDGLPEPLCAIYEPRAPRRRCTRRSPPAAIARANSSSTRTRSCSISPIRARSTT